MHLGYMKIVFRHLWKNRLYSVLTSMGLSMGMMCVLLAVLYVQDEWSFDQFHERNPHLYRITTTLIQNQGELPQTTGGTGQVQGPAFKAQVPEIEDYVRVMGGDIITDVRANEKTLKLRTLYVDDTFFDVFSFKLLQGSPQTALREVNAVVITEAMAMRFFNTTDVLGKLIHLDTDPSARQVGKPLIITGVVQNPPHNSSIQFDLLHPFRFMQLAFDDKTWLNAYLGTFVVLRPDADISAVTQKFNQIFALTAKKQLDERLGKNLYDPKISYGLQQMTAIHLDPMNQASGNREGGIIQESNPVYSYLFLAIASFVLLMASINFVNISIAGSLKRAREVGIRKVNGSSRLQIISQFLAESTTLCLIAFVLSLVWVQILLPLFNELSGKHISLSQTWNLPLIVSFILIFILNSLLTGIYPAYLLSNFKPVDVLYSTPKLTGRHWQGRSLVVVQFVLSITLMIAALVFYRQMDYIHTKDLGYNPHQIIRANISGSRDYRQVQALLKNEVAKEPALTGISFGQDYGSWLTATKAGTQTLQSSYQAIDEVFIPLFDLKIIQGRNFLKNSAGDKSSGVIVNEAFVRAAGLNNPIGSTISSDQLNGQESTIIGVVKDFHFGSLKERIQPRVFFASANETGAIWVKLSKAKQAEALRAFEKIYHTVMPDAAYEYHFQDELNHRAYEREQNWQRIITIVTGISMCICCLGLFGLTHLATFQRTREIGVRKVFGASISQIVALFLKLFLKPVALGFLISIPVAHYIMSQWLQNFAYRIAITWWTFALAGALSFVIALGTVIFQAFKAASGNPINALRNE